jgi:hypothetical protein
MVFSDDIGARGEAIFIVRLTEATEPYNRPWFRPHILGAKCATLDYLVELTGARARPGYFFVQVKTTNRGYTNTRPLRLRVSVSQRDIDRMLAFPAPTYLVGIDGTNEQAFIGSVNGTAMTRVTSMPIAYPMHQENLQLLHSEVEQYWMSRDMVMSNSVFRI